jgi:hypothetical protein
MRLDSCAHPTLDGSWLGGRSGVTASGLMQDLSAHGYSGALAIGLPGVGRYAHRDFFDACREQVGLVPVAALTDVSSAQAITADLDVIRDVGYRVVKVHPRLLGYEETLGNLDTVVEACADRGLAVALCTYPEYRSTISPDEARATMASALARRPELPAVALHAGVLDAEPFARLLPDMAALLIDVSLALPKYPEEVKDQVASIMADHPDSVALGSDGPEWTYEQIDVSLNAIAGRLGGAATASLAGGALARWMSIVDPAHRWAEPQSDDQGVPVSGTP